MLHPKKSHHQESHGPLPFLLKEKRKNENKTKILLPQSIWYPQETALSLQPVWAMTRRAIKITSVSGCVPAVHSPLPCPGPLLRPTPL